MHELALTQSVVDLVAERTAGRPVTRVRLQVGELAGVVPDAMKFCFELTTVGTPVEGAALDIEHTPGRIRCRDCDRESPSPDRLLLCGCGSADVVVVSGEELVVVSFDVVEEEPCA